jgi:hypothetical protein
LVISEHSDQVVAGIFKGSCRLHAVLQQPELHQQFSGCPGMKSARNWVHLYKLKSMKYRTGVIRVALVISHLGSDKSFHVEATDSLNNDRRSASER